MAANGRKDVFRARSGEKPTGQSPTPAGEKGMKMEEEEERRSVSPTLQSESEGAKKWVGREGAQFMRFILAFWPLHSFSFYLGK